MGIQRHGPIGVVELAELAGRDYTTVSRQVTKLESLGLIARHASKADKRVRAAVITAKGRTMAAALGEARERLAGAAPRASPRSSRPGRKRKVPLQVEK